MSRPALVTVAVGAAAAIVTGASAASRPAPARVQVTANEYRLALSRVQIRRGPVVVELYNLGEDDHDLALRRMAKGARTYRIHVVAPGRVAELEARLAPGRYALWCTLADHRARGMRATLVVRPR